MSDDASKAAAAELMEQASTAHAQGRRAEAIELFRQVLDLLPESTEGWYELGYLLKAEGRFDEALDAYAQALARGIRRAEEVHLNRAVIYSDHLRRDVEAEAELKAALALAPGYESALLNLGNLHEERGQRDEALIYYDLLLATAGDPKDGSDQGLRNEALARMVNLRPPASLDDPLLRQLSDASGLGVRQEPIVRANLLFALGRAHDKLGAFDAAFDAFAKANRSLLRLSGRTYDRVRAARLIDTIIETFQPGAATGTDATTGKGPSPLFICGMFRSGSTLVEQVLAGHPRITAGGELNYLLQLATGPLAPYPASMAVANPERDATLAADYRSHLAKLFPDAAEDSYITDKRPDNFLLISLIKRLFPAAKIINTRRNPLDNGLSIFMQHLDTRVLGYSSDLGDIGHYFSQYTRLMAHWKRLYADSIFDFDYDAFVGDPKAALLPLFDFLDLEWDEHCLEFHRLGNTVKTGSYWQVRRPLYGDASGRWRNYDRHLEPLRAALREAGIEPEQVR